MNRPEHNISKEEQIKVALELLSDPRLMADNQYKEWLSDRENMSVYEEMRSYKEALLFQSVAQYPVSVFERRKFIDKLQNKRRRQLFLKVLPYAALVVLALGTSLFLLTHREKEDSFISSSEPKSDSIVPGSFKAILVTDSGETLALGDSLAMPLNANGQVDTTSVDIDYKDKQIKYTDNKKAKKIHYHTLRIPKGGTYSLTLADGTKVWLNSDSELTYPTQFVDSLRLVKLKGEAYFEVSHSRTRPFEVKTGNITTRVYGTEFNARSYQEEVDITLVSGSVALMNEKSEEVVFLDPGENAKVVGTEPAKIEKVNVNKYTAWKEGYFYFEKNSLDEIVNELERWYDVDVIFLNNDLRELEFEFWMKRESSIDDVLSILKNTNAIDFTINKRNVIISKKN